MRQKLSCASYCTVENNKELHIHIFIKKKQNWHCEGHIELRIWSIFGCDWITDETSHISFKSMIQNNKEMKLKPVIFSFRWTKTCYFLVLVRKIKMRGILRGFYLILDKFRTEDFWIECSHCSLIRGTSLRFYIRVLLST